MHVRITSYCLTVVIAFRCCKCPRLPEEARKKKEREIMRQETEEGGANAQLYDTDHGVLHVQSPYEGNVDQPLDSPGNVDTPLTPLAASQEVNVVYNPSALHSPATRPSQAAVQKPPATRYNRFSHEPSDAVELRYIRSRTTSEVRDSLRDSYYHESTGSRAETSPIHNLSGRNSSSQLPPVMSTSTRI